MHPHSPTPTHTTLAWLCILILAIANGGLRENVLIPALGKTAGTALSGVLLILIVLVVAYALVCWRRPRSTGQALRVGVGWVLMTLLFEFGFGLLQGKPLAELLAAYRFEDGNLWPLVLLVILFAPYLATRLTQRNRASH